MKKSKIIFQLFLFYLINNIYIVLNAQEFEENFKLLTNIILKQNSNILIGNIKDCFIDTKLGIAIADNIMNNIKIYDLNGNIKSVIGKKGKGPGEFQAPFTLTMDDRFIYVVDPILRRLTLFKKNNLKFYKQFYVFDGRAIKVFNNRIFIAAPILGNNRSYSLQIYELSDENLKKINETVPLPDIMIKNHLVSDKIDIDIDLNGNIYLIHEMDYKIYKLNFDGSIINVFSGKANHYTPPPIEPFEEFYSRKKLANWIKSWTHLIEIVILKNLELILVNSINFNPTRSFFLDIYRVNGELLYSDIKTSYPLLCTDNEDNIYFLEKIERNGSIDFIIKKYQFRNVNKW